MRVLIGTLLLACTGVAAVAASLQEDFSSNPFASGWMVFGDTNLFFWNATNQNLEVTWDSSQVNSYFYHPLQTTLTTNDDFSLAFDLRLDEVETTGYGDEIAVSLFNFADAARSNFDRVIGADPVAGPRNVVEFDYFPGAGDETISPTMISSDDDSYAQWATAFFFPDQLTGGVVFHIAIAFTATNQSLATTITTGDGQTWMAFPPVTPSLAFRGFVLDTVAVSSYDGSSDPDDSTLAHGVVDNITVTLPPPPVQNFTGGFTNHWWRAQFTSSRNWLYTLERTVDFAGWADVSTTFCGNATNLSIDDTNPPAGCAFYRIRAQRP